MNNKLTVEIPQEIAEDEILVRYLFSSDFKKKNIDLSLIDDRNIFLPYKGGVSMQRNFYCDENDCKKRAKNIPKDYVGFVVFRKLSLEEIKADLGIGDAEIGFLYGTAFAVFYAVFGIPLGRLADMWNRKKLISMGLSFWSLMTAMSGFAQNFGSLAFCRFGVGVGEASATPAAFSMLSDYFSPKVRASVLAIYSSGIYLGSGIGLFLGGAIVHTWHGWYPDPTLAPLGIKAWQAAFLAVGIPGILMAFWVWTLREPVKGASEGILTPAHPAPFKAAGSS